MPMVRQTRLQVWKINSIDIFFLSFFFFFAAFLMVIFKKIIFFLSHFLLYYHINFVIKFLLLFKKYNSLLFVFSPGYIFLMRT
jgi:hypothetical protein